MVSGGWFASIQGHLFLMTILINDLIKCLVSLWSTKWFKWCLKTQCSNPTAWWWSCWADTNLKWFTLLLGIISEIMDGFLFFLKFFLKFLVPSLSKAILYQNWKYFTETDVTPVIITDSKSAGWEVLVRQIVWRSTTYILTWQAGCRHGLWD